MISIDPKEVERYLGYRKIRAEEPGMEALIRKCIQDIQESISPGSVYQFFPILRSTEEACSIGGIKVTSQSLLRNLKGCTKAAILAVTIGPGPDMLVRRAEVQNMLKACVYQAAGAAAVETWCDEVNEKIRGEAAEMGMFLRPRFSPGYGDFPLEVQKDFERILHMRKKIGIALTDSLLMTPTKSVTAVIGLSPEKKAGEAGRCQLCSMSGKCTYQCEAC